MEWPVTVRNLHKIHYVIFLRMFPFWISIHIRFTQDSSKHMCQIQRKHILVYKCFEITNFVLFLKSRKLWPNLDTLFFDYILKLRSLTIPCIGDGL